MAISKPLYLRCTAQFKKGTYFFKPKLDLSSNLLHVVCNYTYFLLFFKLMKDGAPVHGSKTSKAWRDGQSLIKLEWPANSPDLNPIENVWRVMKDVVQQKKRPKNADEMKAALQAAWETIPTEKLEQLVCSMPNRMKAVVEAKGGSTSW